MMYNELRREVRDVKEQVNHLKFERRFSEVDEKRKRMRRQIVVYIAKFRYSDKVGVLKASSVVPVGRIVNKFNSEVESLQIKTREEYGLIP